MPARGAWQRSLPSAACRIADGSRRAAGRITANVDSEKETKGNEQQATYTREYVVGADAELPRINACILALMDEDLIPSASTGEPKVLYYVMKGDYCRFLAERATSDAKSKAGDEVCVGQKTVEVHR